MTHFLTYFAVVPDLFIWAFFIVAQPSTTIASNQEMLQNTIPVFVRENHHFSISSIKQNSAGHVIYPNDLKNTKNKADYIIITTQDFYHHPDLHSFAWHRASFNNFGVAVINCDFIYSQFPNTEQYESIKSFLTFAYFKWSSYNLVDPHPRFVLLVGEGHSSGPNSIPSFTFSKNYTATDFWYACVTDDNEDGVINKGDRDFDLVIGRFSVDDEKELTNITNKTIAYETSLDENSHWRQKISLLSLFEKDSITTTTNSICKLYDTFSTTIHGDNYFYIEDDLRKAEWDSESLKSHFYDAFNSGRGILNIHAHGDIRSLGNGAGWFLCQEADTCLIENQGKLPVILTFACESGKFYDCNCDCLGEILMNMQDKGAIAFIGSLAPVQFDINVELNLHFMEILEQIENISLGEAFFYARHLANANYKYNLLGDPALSISGTVQSYKIMPDLVIQSADLNYKPATKWSQTTISATVHNRGRVRADNVLVRFYSKSPAKETISIAEKKLNFIDPNGAHKRATVTSIVDIIAGEEILVTVDEADFIAELNDKNNSASIYVLPDLSISIKDVNVSKAATSGYPDTLKAIIHNVGFYEASDVLIQIFDESFDEPLQLGEDIYLDNIKAHDSSEAVLFIRHNFREHSSFSIKIDPYDTIIETDNENNFVNTKDYILPDLTIESKDIHHYRVSPMHDKDNLSIKIYNMGAADTRDIMVQIFIKNSNGGRVQLEENIIIDEVKAGGDYAHILKTIDPIEHDNILIQVVIDPHNFIAELDDHNNSAETQCIRSVFNAVEVFSCHGQQSYCAVGDINGDKLLDFLILNNSNVDIYQNNGKNSFSLLGDGAGGLTAFGICAPTFVDFNNDSKLDIYFSDNRFYENVQFQRFEPATLIDNFNKPMHTGKILSFLDANNDGLLDILACQYYSLKNSKDEYEQLFSQVLLQNENNNIYSDISLKSGLYPKSDPSVGGSVAAVGDYDNDGYMDLYLAVNNFFNGLNYKRQYLFAGNGDGTFANKTQYAGLAHELENVVAKAEFADYDNDGDLDLFVGGLLPNLIIYQNNSDGTFGKCTSLDLKNKQFHTLLDYDNDGYMDLFFKVYNDVSEQSWLFYRNDHSGGFELESDAFQMYHQASRLFSSAFGDMNQDGFIDMLCTFTNARSILYQNYGNTHNWIHINLEGTTSNTCGIGARVRVVAGDLVQIRDMLCSVDPNQRVQHSQTLEFGLGEHTIIDSILVAWPSGENTILTNEKVNSILTIKENCTAEIIPDYFSMLQNYPNPFNPTTIITYELPNSTHVQLTIYNVLGRRVKRIRDEYMSAGRYNVMWDATNDHGERVAAGLYFCRMEAKDFVEVIKLALVK